MQPDRPALPRRAMLAAGLALRTLVSDSAAFVWLAFAAISSLLGVASALVLGARRRTQRSIV